MSWPDRSRTKRSQRITRSRHARGPRGEGLRLSCSGDLAQGGADLLARIADRCHFGELEEGAQLGPVGVSGLVATELASASASYRSGESLDLSPFDEETSLEEARAHVERVVRDMRLERLERDPILGPLLRE